MNPQTFEKISKPIIKDLEIKIDRTLTSMEREFFLNGIAKGMNFIDFAYTKDLEEIKECQRCNLCEEHKR